MAEPVIEEAITSNEPAMTEEAAEMVLAATAEEQAPRRSARRSATKAVETILAVETAAEEGPIETATIESEAVESEEIEEAETPFAAPAAIEMAKAEITEAPAAPAAIEVAEAEAEEEILVAIEETEVPLAAAVTVTADEAPAQNSHTALLAAGAIATLLFFLLLLAKRRDEDEEEQ